MEISRTVPEKEFNMIIDAKKDGRSSMKND